VDNTRNNGRGNQFLGRNWAGRRPLRQRGMSDICRLPAVAPTSTGSPKRCHQHPPRASRDDTWSPARAAAFSMLITFIMLAADILSLNITHTGHINTPCPSNIQARLGTLLLVIVLVLVLECRHHPPSVPAAWSAVASTPLWHEKIRHSSHLVKGKRSVPTPCNLRTSRKNGLSGPRKKLNTRIQSDSVG